MIMKKNGFNWIKVAFVGFAMTSFVACSDDSAPAGKGEAEIEITDAPSDDASIKSVMVTVAEIKINGQTVSGFQKQTIDLKAYQEGSTKLLLGSTQLDAKSTNKIALVLDLDTDEDGNSPGCYVLTNDFSKFKLKSTATGKVEIAANQAWQVMANAKSRIVIDFDLRKAIKNSEDASVKYTFVSDENLKAAVKVVSREKSGTIKGTFTNDSDADADMIVAYAYKKGTFNASTETQAQSEDQITFKNAAGSAVVKSTLSGKTYTMAFLEEGDYEIHFAAYHKDAATGRYAFTTRLQSETTADGAIADVIKVKAGLSVNISSSIKGSF
jgi:hypothetical protein